MQSQGINVPAGQQMRFAKKTPVKIPRTIQKVGDCLLKDHNLRMARPGWAPTFLTAVRMIILVRFFAAMYSNISDCDEVFNYWEPLHYLMRGKGFQTWEYSPVYAIRSYFYLLVNALPGFLAQRLPDKRASFFALRLSFAFVSSLVEATFYRATVNHLSPHIGRYVLLTILFSAGFWSASTAFLPSTFAMWGVMLGTAAGLSPPDGGWKRISAATFGFAAAAIVGWPFAALLGVPLVVEQLFVRGSEKVAPGQSALWAMKRARNLFVAGVFGLSLLLPVISLDSQAYKKLAIVPYNIISYNLLSTSGGPTLYGTEPPSFYIYNGLLAFNILFPLALLSLPILFISAVVDPKRFGDLRDRIPTQTDPVISVAIRLSPLYLWLGVLTLQPHKEERFLYPAYGLIILNACTSLYLIRGWFEQAFLHYTKSPYKLTQSKLFSNFTRIVVTTTAIISLCRITALHKYYHAPLNVYHHLQTFELPRLAIATFPTIYPTFDATLPFANFSQALTSAETTVDLAPLGALNLRLCLGKEWHRFPSHYLVPDELEVQFVKSAFNGILPKHWEAPGAGKGLFGRATGVTPTSMNDMNREEHDRYVDIATCHYLIDLDFPNRSREVSLLEPRYAVDSKNWDRVHCHKFLDNEQSSQASRTIWLPVPRWESRNSYGDYCLLRSKNLL